MKKGTKKQTLRDESEKRQSPASVRMTKREEEIIERKAEEYGMSVSRYLIYAGVNLKNISPELMVHLQNFTNQVYDGMVKIHPGEAERIRKEMNKLWSLL